MKQKEAIAKYIGDTRNERQYFATATFYIFLVFRTTILSVLPLFHRFDYPH